MRSATVSRKRGTPYFLMSPAMRSAPSSQALIMAR